MTFKVKLVNGDIMTLPKKDGFYCWDSIIFHQRSLNDI